MYGGFADAELPGGGTHRGTVLYDVKRQPAGAFLVILTGDVYAPKGPDMWWEPLEQNSSKKNFPEINLR